MMRGHVSAADASEKCAPASLIKHPSAAAQRDVRGRMNGTRWQQPLPKWARIACGVLAFVSAGAAILRPSNMTLLGIAVGGVCALLSWKGIPLIASVASATEVRSVRIAEGLRTIRRRRRLTVAVALICPSFAAGLAPVIPHRFFPTVLFLSGIPVIVCMFRFVLSACPRCDHHFFLSNQLIGAMARCQHCNISLRWVRGDL
jgi:hypothetical protein